MTGSGRPRPAGGLGLVNKNGEKRDFVAMSDFIKTAVRMVCVAGMLATAGHALADTKKEKDKDKDALRPSPRWSAPTATGASIRAERQDAHLLCARLAKTRDPDDLKRDAGYAFISERPGERVRNEVSFVMGFDLAALPMRPRTRRTKRNPTRRTRRPRPKSRSALARWSATRISNCCRKARTSGSRTLRRKVS